MAEAGDYELLGLIGSGGMGEVYLAAPRGRPGERVALKRLRGAHAGDRDQLAREARIGALLQHPNIASVKAFGDDDQGPFLVMEYVEGCSLERLVAGATEAFSAEEVVALALALSRALAAAHGHTPRAVLHRDVSLDNVLVSKHGEVKLTDFGVARLVDATTQTQQGTLKGKLSYLAPERFEGADATAAADVFALGVTLFRMASGIAPFAGVTEAQVIHAVLHVQPPSLATLRPDLPPVFTEAVDACLQKEAARRPTAAQLVERLTPWERAEAALRLCARVATVGVAAQPLAPRTQTSIRHRPKRRRAALLVALPIGLIAGSAGVWLATTTPPPPVVEQPAPAEPPATTVSVEPEPEPPPEDTPVVVEPPAVAAKKPRTAPRPKPAPPEAPKPAAPVEAQLGALAIKVRPWGRVFVDGKLVGTTPLAPLPLSAGRHSVIVVNEALNARRQEEVVVPAGGTETLRIFLD